MSEAHSESFAELKVFDAVKLKEQKGIKPDSALKGFSLFVQSRLSSSLGDFSMPGSLGIV